MSFLFRFGKVAYALGRLLYRSPFSHLQLKAETIFVITEIIMVKSVFVSQHLLPVPDLGGSNACIIS